MSSDDRDHDSGLVLRPFRATRYGPGLGTDVGTVTSPPYDVIDDETVGQLYECHPYNVVRLILPRRFAQAPSYDGVRDLLEEWVAAGVLVHDDEPALYVYEYVVNGRVVRGLVGALGLRRRETATVLPHEDVMPGPVADRAELIARTGTNLEPILLVYDGDGRASDLVDSVGDEDLLLATVAMDGSTHRVWRITDEAALQQIADDLGPRQALIADGHHRYAAYQQVQRTENAPEFGYGLALLVDQQRYPLQLGPIHRVVCGAKLDDLLARVPATCMVHDVGEDSDAARTMAAADAPSDTAVFAATDGRRWVVLHAPRSPGHIDTHVVHDDLLPAWGVEEDQVRYVHDADHAVTEAHANAGVAILVRPPSVPEVIAAAEQGRGLPRKSTSFGPKPRMGLLMRTVDRTSLNTGPVTEPISEH